MDWLSISVLAFIIFFLVNATVFVSAVVFVALGLAKRWRRMARNALITGAITYLLAGASMGMAFKLMTPAMTWKGVGYLTVIWPVWQSQDVTGYHPPIPAWVFYFGD